MLNVIESALQSIFEGSVILLLVAAVLYHFLDKSLTIKFDTLKEKELAKYKAELDEKLHSTIHKLELEQAKLSYVYDSQGESFKKILDAMNNAINKLEQPYDEKWTMMPMGTFDDFLRIVNSESLYLDKDGDFALRLFNRFLFSAEWFPDCVEKDNRELRSIYSQLHLIHGHLAAHLKGVIGVDNFDYPMDDIYLLSAMLFYNDYADIGKDSPLRYDPAFGTIDFLKDLKHIISDVIAAMEQLKDKFTKDGYGLSIQHESMLYIDRLKEIKTHQGAFDA